MADVFVMVHPRISPEYARLQVDRVASARSLPVEEVQKVVDSATAAPAPAPVG